MTQPKRSLEEIAGEMPCTCPGEYHEPLVYVNCARVRCLAALREAVEAAVRQERLALRERLVFYKTGKASGRQVLKGLTEWLDARSRPEEPKG